MAGVSYTIRFIDLASRVAKNIDKNFERLQRRAERLSSSIDMIGVAAAGAAVAGVFKLGAELESTQVQFEVFMKSAEKGNKLMNEINEFANMTPFSNQGLLKNSKMLLAMGVTAKQMIPTLKAIGSVAGTDEVAFARIAQQYGQVLSRGKLEMEEFKIFAENGLNIHQVLAEATGKSKKYFAELQSKGKLTADHMVRAFKYATSGTGQFAGMIEKLANTMSGKWSTVMGKAKFTIAKFGLSLKAVFVPIIEKALVIVDKFSDWVDKNGETIVKWGKIISYALPVFLSLVTAIKLASAVMMANPLGLAIAGFSLLAGWLIKAWNESERFRQVTYGVIAAIKETASVIWEVIGPPLTWLGQTYVWLATKQINFAKSIYDFVVSPLADAGKESDSLADKIKSGIGSALRYALSYLGNMAKAVKAFMKGEFAEAWSFAEKGGDNLFGGGEADLGFITDRVKRVKDAYEKGKKAIEEAEKKMKSGGADGAPAMGATDALSAVGGGQGSEANALRASGVASGGINTFNVNIAKLNGIETFSSVSAGETPDVTANAVRDAILNALADVKVE